MTRPASQSYYGIFRRESAGISKCSYILRLTRWITINQLTGLGVFINYKEAWPVKLVAKEIQNGGKYLGKLVSRSSVTWFILNHDYYEFQSDDYLTQVLEANKSKFVLFYKFCFCFCFYLIHLSAHLSRPYPWPEKGKFFIQFCAFTLSMILRK